MGDFKVIKGVFRAMFRITIALGIGKTPPPCWEKFPNNPVSFYECLPEEFVNKINSL